MSANKDINKLEKILGVNFKDRSILKNALIHRSYLNEHHIENTDNNERLEFLGDAVLELITTEYLFKHYPERHEGDLTSFRSALVKTTSLSDTALALKLGDFIQMSKGEEITGGRTRPYILANTFEAIVGAIYLDQGYDIAKNFLVQKLFPKITEIVENRLDIDPKSKLQEISQEELNYTPVYELISSKGPDHNKSFLMAVKIKNKVFGKGEGRNKQEAEQNAAQDALSNWSEIT